MGAAAAPFSAFAPWPRLTEDAPDSTAPETLLRAACAPAPLLDMVENFTVFEEERGGLVKKLARYHQVLGVNRAIESVRRPVGDKARGGSAWCGTRRAAARACPWCSSPRKCCARWATTGPSCSSPTATSWTTRSPTTYAATGALTKAIEEAQAQSRADLRRLLAGQERYVFTLIHKFGTERGEADGDAVRSAGHHRHHRRGASEPV